MGGRIVLDTQKKMIALLDCNNFYVSCERVFQPRLENMHTLVTSNNDGCVVARSNSVKNLGIKMGQPLFEIQHLVRKYKIQVLSSNYTLYADMSRRFQEVIKPFGIRYENYSIDESFLDLTGINNLTEYCQNIKMKVRKGLGLPICVGIGETKVLAKFANYLAKKYPFLNGVCDLKALGDSRVNKAMQIVPVDEVWGIGSKIADKLKIMGIKTVYDLKTANAKHLAKLFSVNVERIIYELNGLQCMELETIIEPNKQIVSSRSFGKAVTSRDALHSSLVYHLQNISNKLSKQMLFARSITIFAHTNRFKDNYISNAINIMFPAALDSNRLMAKYLETGLNALYIPNLEYKKSGVIVNDIVSNEQESIDLFDNLSIVKDNLKPTIDIINKRFGKGTINLSSALLSGDWKM